MKNLLAIHGLMNGADTKLFEDTNFYDRIESSICLNRGNDTRADAEEEELVKYWDSVKKGEVNPFIDQESITIDWSNKTPSIFQLKEGRLLQHFHPP